MRQRKHLGVAAVIAVAVAAAAVAATLWAQGASAKVPGGGSGAENCARATGVPDGFGRESRLERIVRSSSAPPSAVASPAPPA